MKTDYGQNEHETRESPGSELEFYHLTISYHIKNTDENIPYQTEKSNYNLIVIISFIYIYAILHFNSINSVHLLACIRL